MQFILMINQVKALEWGLNAQQAMLFAVVYDAPRWAEPVYIDGKIFFKLSKSKIISELPLLTDKPDTAYRLLKALELVEIVELSSTSTITLVRITEKGSEWNTSEKNPSRVGKKSEVGSEKNPTDQVTSNQVTRDQDQKRLEGEWFDSFWKLYPNKTAKPKAQASFAKKCRSQEDFERIMAGLAKHVRSELFVKDEGRFIPHPTTWLNQDRFNDEVKPYVAGQSNPGADRPRRLSLVEQVRAANAHHLIDEPPAWEPGQGDFDAEFDRIREVDGSLVGADD